MNKYILIGLIITLISVTGCETIIEEELVDDIRKTEEEISNETGLETKPEIKEEPKVCDLELGGHCCEYPKTPYSISVSGVCKDEEELYLKREAAALKNYPSVGKVITSKDLGFSFLEPERWYVMKNYKMGGMDVPISYFKYTEEKRRTKATRVEIRVVHYKNEDNLSIEEFKTKIASLLTRGRIKSKSQIPKSRKLPIGSKETYTRNLEVKHDIFKGIWFDIYKYGNWDEDWYFVAILEHKNSYYLIIFIDPMEREVTTYYNDAAWKTFDRVYEGFRFIDFKDNVYKIKISPNQAWHFPLNFEKPTEVRYEIESERNIDFYFVKSYEDVDKYARNPRESKFEFYEDCKHIGIKKAEGSCLITESKFMIGNLGNEYNNVTLSLSW